MKKRITKVAYNHAKKIIALYLEQQKEKDKKTQISTEGNGFYSLD